MIGCDFFVNEYINWLKSGIKVADVGGVCEITTPFLDRHRDHLQIYVKHSGDDLILLVSLGIDNLYKKVRVRLYGVDTPDANKAGSDTEAGRVRDQVNKLIKGKKCMIRAHSQGAGKGGWVVTLHLDLSMNTETLNEILRQEGYVFGGKSNDS